MAVRPFHDTDDNRDPEVRVILWNRLEAGDAGLPFELPPGSHAVTVAAPSGIVPNGTVAVWCYSNDLQNWGTLKDTAGEQIVNAPSNRHVASPLPIFIRPAVDWTSPAGASVNFELHVAFRQIAPVPARDIADNVVTITS